MIVFWGDRGSAAFLVDDFMVSGSGSVLVPLYHRRPTAPGSQEVRYPGTRAPAPPPILLVGGGGRG
jgi:hypothetical protein